MGIFYVAVVLISGFVFTNLYLPARYKQKRSIGWDSYFHVAQWGAWICSFTLLTGLVVDYYDLPSSLLDNMCNNVDFLSGLIVGYYTPPSTLLDKMCIKVSDFTRLSVDLNTLKSACWAIASLFMAYIAGWTTRLYYTLRKKSKFKLIAKALEHDNVSKFLIEVSLSKSLVLITLKSRKCYVGYSVGEIDHDNIIDGSGRAYVEIIPLISGYRNEKNLSLDLDVSYADYYKKNSVTKEQLQRFMVLLPLSEIESFSKFDSGVYREFINNKYQRKHSSDYTADISYSYRQTDSVGPSNSSQ
ncbi:hypothetical protein [Shewanella sp. YQ_9]|uniref:hypothetical protein n=1 Tax=Shewanella sp. YQ_9 TaxID=3367231 RepID=UPI00370B5058